MKLIASDIDGTILGTSGEVSPRVVRAFADVVAAGIELVFVTGRPSRWLDPLRDQVGHVGRVICSNGAQVYDLAEDRSLATWPIPPDSVLAARAAIKELVPSAVFATEGADGLHVEQGFDPREDSPLSEIVPAPLTESITSDSQVLKFLAKAHHGSPDAFLASVKPAVAQWVDATHSATGVALLEMSAPGVNKAATLKRYAASLGLDAADVVAFGDMPNDIEMLNWAGRGYAMASGHERARAAADLQAPSLADDGVAVVIEELLAKQGLAARN